MEEHEVLCDSVQRIWNGFAGKHGLSKVLLMTDSRKDRLRRRAREWAEVFPEPIDAFSATLAEAVKSPFLMGKDGGWKLTFDYVIRSHDTWVRILEGGYAGGAGPDDLRGATPA